MKTEPNTEPLPDDTTLEVIEPSALEAIERAQVDVQIATAHRFRRPDPSVIKKKIISYATLDEETAQGCFYVVPRGGKNIVGPSVRLAEMALNCFGNISAGAREISNDGKSIVVQAVCHDLEANVRVCIEVKRKITDKNGKTFNEDMQIVTANAARSIALRNAIFKVVPMALVRPAFDAARKVAIGDAQTLADRRARAMEIFTKMGIATERILAVLEKKSVEDVDLNDLETLQGIRTSLKDGDTTVDQAFPPLSKRAPLPEDPKTPPTTPAQSDANAAATVPASKAAQPDSAKKGATVTDDPEKTLAAWMELNKVLPEELGRQLKTSGKSIPRNFGGPGDLTDETLRFAIEKWPDLLNMILTERKAAE